ncbi:UNVERIFIED_CONTAM: hypothetical protein GTU68_024717, partial [Idotea baltica]|nr:hypothetical protein [Idotea baltica]MCL4135978.1 hypothetical protein [Idotea baltica]
MEDGLLSLKWNNHKTTFFEILRVLRDKANYTDATLAVEGKFYPVHKLVLSTCSEYFSEIFERTPCKCPVIVLKDVRSQDLESLLDYMYLGEVNVNQNDLALLLKTAECLRIKGLAVPDDDPNRHSNTSTPHQKVHSLSTDEATKDIPPAKRRKEDTSASPISPPRISPTSKVPSSPPHTPTIKVNKVAPEPSSPGEHLLDNPLVKVEMEEVEDGEEAFQSDTNYDSNTEMENREFAVEKSEHDPSIYPNTTNFSLTSTQQAGEISWEDGENSFPQEAFDGDPGQQAGG